MAVSRQGWPPRSSRLAHLKALGEIYNFKKSIFPRHIGARPKIPRYIGDRPKIPRYIGARPKII